MTSTPMISKTATIFDGEFHNNNLPFWLDADTNQPMPPFYDPQHTYLDGWCDGCCEVDKKRPVYECVYPCELRSPYSHVGIFTGMFDDGTITNSANRVRCDTLFRMCQSCIDKAEVLCETNEPLSCGYEWWDLCDGLSDKLEHM